MCPFAGEDEFHDFLLAPASGYGFETWTEYINLRPRNVLVGGDGHLAGFLDWESAGWYPEYWDFTTAMKFGAGGLVVWRGWVAWG